MQSTVTEFKADLTKRLATAAADLTNKQHLQICLNLDISLKTLNRYTSGNAEEVRRMELAEKILAEIQAVK